VKPAHKSFGIAYAERHNFLLPDGSGNADPVVVFCGSNPSDFCSVSGYVQCIEIITIKILLNGRALSFRRLQPDTWRSHEENWIFPQTLGADVISTPEEAADIFDFPQSSPD